MKLDNIKKLVKETKRICIYDGSTQWISNGNCAAPLTGLPKINKDNVLRILSLEDEAEKYVIEVHPNARFSDEDRMPDETDAVPMAPVIVRSGNRYTFLDTEIGAIAVDASYISMFKRGGTTSYSLREKLIAVFSGMILDGYIAPVIFSEALIDELIKLQGRLRAAERSGFITVTAFPEQIELE